MKILNKNISMTYLLGIVVGSIFGIIGILTFIYILFSILFVILLGMDMSNGNPPYLVD